VFNGQLTNSVTLLFYTAARNNMVFRSAGTHLKQSVDNAISNTGSAENAR